MNYKFVSLAVLLVIVCLATYRYVDSRSRRIAANARMESFHDELSQVGGQIKVGPLGLIYDVSDAEVSEEWVVQHLGQMVSADEVWLAKAMETVAVKKYLEDNKRTVIAKVTFLPQSKRN